MIQVLVEQERIAEKRKTGDPDGVGRKDVRLLRDKVLRSVILAHRETGDIGAHRRKGICGRTTAIHVAEIQGVCPGKIMIEPQTELVVIGAQGLRGDESIFPFVRQRKKGQDIRRNRVNGREKSQLVEGHRCAKERQLLLRVAADPAGVKSSRKSALFREIALPFGGRWHGRRHTFALPVAEAFVVSEEKSLVLEDWPAKSSAKLVLLQRLNSLSKVIGRIHRIIAQKFPESTME